jgi:uncharacterized protein YqhQ
VVNSEGTSPARIRVGGQAVIEGVMMRSPRSMAIAVRRPGGDLVIREQPWVSLWERLRFLKWPLLRGSVVLIESLVNGIQALSFSANRAAESEPRSEAAGEAPSGDALGSAAIAGTIALALALGIVLFVVVPHALTQAIAGWTHGQFSVRSVAFHGIDGAIKIVLFLAYVWGISRMRDIRRVFEYHGAEHMSIFAYEKGLPLTVENVRRFATLHPRCGTSFLMLVILVSIGVFSVSFPLLPALPGWPAVLRHLVYVAIKIPMLLPIAGLSYEIIRLAGKREENALLRLLVLPGMWLQRITTQPPSDDQIEVAILSLKKVLWREAVGTGGGEASEETFSDFADAVARVGAPL